MQMHNRQAVRLPYLLTPWSRVLLEKLTGSAASQEIHHIFWTGRFITVLTSARHLSLSGANSIQSPQLPPTSWRSILILSSHLRLGLPSGLFPSGFPTRTLCTPPPYAPHAYNDVNNRNHLFKELKFANLSYRSIPKKILNNQSKITLFLS